MRRPEPIGCRLVEADAVKDEKAMSSDKKTQTPNKQTKVVTPDALTKTTKKGTLNCAKRS
jgi:hypothetical protein